MKYCIVCNQEIFGNHKLYCSSICRQKGVYRKKYGIDIRNKTTEEIFWSKVNKTDYCWEWAAGCFDTGYGAFHNDSNNVGAHVFSWSLINGPVPKDKQINHKCDNRKCVNPNHLYLGTQQDNQKDAVDRNRTLKGEKNKNAKLKEKDVLEIRQRHNNGESYSEIANIFNIDKSNVALIVKRKHWKHI